MTFLYNQQHITLEEIPEMPLQRDFTILNRRAITKEVVAAFCLGPIALILATLETRRSIKLILVGVGLWSTSWMLLVLAYFGRTFFGWILFWLPVSLQHLCHYLLLLYRRLYLLEKLSLEGIYY